MAIAKTGLGCVTFGREIDKQMSFRMMDHAISIGISSFDTAAAYGHGSSEKIIGEWIRERKFEGKVTIATKVLPPYRPAELLTSVEECRLRLGISTIDILYFHRWDDTLKDPFTTEVLGQLITEKKVKEFGVSNFNSMQLKTVLNLFKNKEVLPGYLQNNHNLAVSDLTSELKENCLENGIRIVTYSPLGAGFLTGKHLNGVRKNSRFEILPAHQNIYFNSTAEKRLNKLLEISDQSRYPPALLAMAWAIRQPFVDYVLVGGRSLSHLDLATRAREFDDEEVLSRVQNECCSITN